MCWVIITQHICDVYVPIDGDQSTNGILWYHEIYFIFQHLNIGSLHKYPKNGMIDLILTHTVFFPICILSLTKVCKLSDFVTNSILKCFRLPWNVLYGYFVFYSSFESGQCNQCIKSEIKGCLNLIYNGNTQVLKHQLCFDILFNNSVTCFYSLLAFGMPIHFYNLWDICHLTFKTRCIKDTSYVWGKKQQNLQLLDDLACKSANKWSLTGQNV